MVNPVYVLVPDKINVPEPDLVSFVPLTTLNIVLEPLLVIVAPSVAPLEAILTPRFAFNVTPSAKDNVAEFPICN